jgi:hypothetical protein
MQPANLPTKPAPPAPARVKPISEAEIQLAEQAYRVWHIDLATLKKTDGSLATLDDLFDPSFWRGAERIAGDDLINVVAADKSWHLQLVVLAKVPGCGLVVRPRHEVDPNSRQYAELRAMCEKVRGEEAEIQAARNLAYGVPT